MFRQDNIENNLLSVKDEQLKKCIVLLFAGYYQPAGPLIQHPPTLPPVKGPPPEPTPTPPQNSEGSDDLVTTSSTSGGTSSTGT